MGKPSLDDYIDVGERIATFKAAHPDGSLQTIDWGQVEVGGKPFVYYQAAAYRDPDDPRPGYGIAWEPFPGPTPYTKDSELMNAETAAWGRAIVALGFASSGKIASRQEVRNRMEAETPAEVHKDDQRAPAPTIPRDRAADILKRAAAIGMAKIDMDAEPGTPPEYHPVFIAVLGTHGVAKIGHLNADTAEAVEAWLAKEEATVGNQPTESVGGSFA